MLLNLENYNPEDFQEVQKIEIPEQATTGTPQSDSNFFEIPTAPPKENVIEAEPEQVNIKPEPTEEEKKTLAERNASMYVNLIDLVVSRGCALLTGETHERYKLSKSESDEYKKVSADYFYTINAQVSPALVFMVSTLTIFSSICFRAFADYKSKVKKKKAEKEAEQKQKEAEIKALEMQRQFNEIAIQQQTQAQQVEPIYINQSLPMEEEPPTRKAPKVYKEEIIEAMEERSNFEIYTEKDKAENSKNWKDELIGKYKRSAANDRLTYDECLKANNNKPSEFIERIIKQYLEQGDSWKEINLKIRRFLRTLKSMTDV